MISGKIESKVNDGETRIYRAGESWSDADRAIDEVRRRFGDRAVGPAALVGRDGLHLKRRGDQQWGPGEEQADSERPSESEP